MQPKISIILPFHNAGKTLYASIKSILDQTFTDFELLLIDNSSTDESSHIAKQLAMADNRIQIFHESQKGVAHAMNCGLAQASGDYIARMDADDISRPDRLEKQLAYLRGNPDTGLVGCHVGYVSHSENTEGFQRFVDWVNSFYRHGEISLNRFVDIPVVNPTLFFRRALYENLGGCIQGDFPEDYEMILRYLQSGVRMYKIPEPLLEWHDYPTRLTRSDERYSSDAFFKIKAGYLKKWLEQNHSKHPPLWIWGAGRKTRQRAVHLENEGLFIHGYIDIDESKTRKKQVIHYTNIPDPGKMFILSMVTNRGAGDQIRQFLADINYREGLDFILLG